MVEFNTQRSGKRVILRKVRRWDITALTYFTVSITHTVEARKRIPLKLIQDKSLIWCRLNNSGAVEFNLNTFCLLHQILKMITNMSILHI